MKASFQVALMFTRFSLQSENNTDAVYVYDGNDQTGKVLGVFYGGQPPPRNGIYSTSNSLLVIFRSDKNGSFYGFQASYSAVKCSGKSLLTDSITKLLSTIAEFEMYLKKIPEEKILIHSHILRIHNAKNNNGSFYGFQASYSAVKCSGKSLLTDSITKLLSTIAEFEMYLKKIPEEKILIHSNI